MPPNVTQEVNSNGNDTEVDVQAAWHDHQKYQAGDEKWQTGELAGRHRKSEGQCSLPR
jgi:hypothetical protein